MLSMESVGFFVAGLSIIGLLRVLFAFRELRGELHDQRLLLNSTRCKMEILQSRIALGDSHERRLRDLESRADVGDRAAQHASYDDATRLVQKGAASGQLARSCGLSRGEAQLVHALWSKDVELS
ncbi:MAG: DUF2802 domain-containing protein [Gammaproteobacteria bacterium]|nr:DUF2802 domain-containing protein [Gammaproteobacteria bacterium]